MNFKIYDNFIMIQGVQLCSSTDVQKVTRPRTSCITKCNVYGCKVKTYVRVCNVIIFITPPPFLKKKHTKKRPSLALWWINLWRPHADISREDWELGNTSTKTIFFFLQTSFPSNNICYKRERKLYKNTNMESIWYIIFMFGIQQSFNLFGLFIYSIP